MDNQCPVSFCVDYPVKGSCVSQGKRGNVKKHEEVAVSHHMLLIRKNSTHLEQKV